MPKYMQRYQLQWRSRQEFMGSQMRSEGFLFYLGALGVDLCSLDVVFVFAFATAGTTAVGTLWGLWPCL